MTTVVKHPVTAYQDEILDDVVTRWKGGKLKSIAIMLLDKNDNVSMARINLGDIELLGLLTKTTVLLSTNAN